MRIGFFSCQDYQAGYYNAHAAMAKEDLDIVVCLGDYIYERTFYEGPADRKDTLGANRDGEVQTLDEYRAKYRMYRRDKNLQAMHAAHPFVAIWDDHEIEDNWAGASPGEATQPAAGCPFLDRRQAGFGPSSSTCPSRPWPTSRTWATSSTAGSTWRNAELFLLDQRSYRDDQPCGDEFFTPCPEAETGTRRFLGRQQMDWLKSHLESSDSTWKLIGSQLMAMALDTAAKQPINKDSWDGYGTSGASCSATCDRGASTNVSFLTGDIHTFFAGRRGRRRPRARERGHGVRGRLDHLAGHPRDDPGASPVPRSRPAQTELVTNNMTLVNPHLRYQDQSAAATPWWRRKPDELEVAYRAWTRCAATPGRRPPSVASGCARDEPRVQVLSRPSGLALHPPRTPRSPPRARSRPRSRASLSAGISPVSEARAQLALAEAAELQDLQHHHQVEAGREGHARRRPGSPRSSPRLSSPLSSE